MLTYYTYYPLFLLKVEITIKDQVLDHLRVPDIATLYTGGMTCHIAWMVSRMFGRSGHTFYIFRQGIVDPVNIFGVRVPN